MSELLPEIERERVHYSKELERHDLVFGRVALVITLTTLLAAGTAYLERIAASHQAAADRHARTKAVEAVGAAIAADVATRERGTLQAAVFDADDLAFEHQGAGGAYEQKLSNAYTTAKANLRKVSNEFFGPRYSVHDGFDSISFQEDQQAPVFAAAEWQKAYAGERASWASKRGGLIFGISLFAIALFLLGLTLAVPAGSRYLFFLIGCVFAAGATGFVLYTWTKETNRPSPRAIAAYARAAAASSAGASNNTIVSAASAAIEHRKRYQAAYELRGEAHMGLALDALSGPVDEMGATGTARAEAGAARDDLRTAARLEPGNYFAWVNLAEALYLLGDFEGALSANERALSLEVSRPVVNLDRIFFLLVTGRPWRAEDPQKAVATTFQHGALKWLLHAPASARDIALSWEERLVNLALHRRPRGMSDGSYADLKAFERRLDQLQAIFDTFPPSHGNPGRSVAPRSQSTVKVTKLTFSADLRTLTEALSYDGAGAEDTRLYFLFVNGTHTITHGPFSWSDPRFKFPVGAGSIEHSFEPSGGFQAGDRIRATIYIQGNLRAVCRFTVAPGTVDPESACDDFGGGSAYGQGQTAAAPATGYTVRRPGA